MNIVFRKTGKEIKSAITMACQRIAATRHIELSLYYVRKANIQTGEAKECH